MTTFSVSIFVIEIPGGICKTPRNVAHESSQGFTIVSIPVDIRKENHSFISIIKVLIHFAHTIIMSTSLGLFGDYPLKSLVAELYLHTLAAG